MTTTHYQFYVKTIPTIGTLVDADYVYDDLKRVNAPQQLFNLLKARKDALRWS